MWAKKYTTKNVFIGRGEYGKDLLAEIEGFCTENKIIAGIFSAIGALKSAKLGYYNQKTGAYEEINLGAEPLEIVSCSGNISLKNGGSFPHIHLVVANAKGATFGGHLLQGCEIFALEFTVTEYDGPELIRVPEEQTSLALWER